MRATVYTKGLFFLSVLFLAGTMVAYSQPANYSWDRFGMGGVVLTANSPVNGTWGNTTQANTSSSYYLVEWDSYWNKWSNTSTPFQSEFTLNWGGGSNNGLNGVLSTPTTLNKYYTLQIRGLAYANRSAVLMETDAMPQSFHANPNTAVSTPTNVVGGSDVTITINLAGNKSAQERVFVRYSSDGFANAKLVEASGTGTTWSTAVATIPASDNVGGATISYYAYTTTVAATNSSNHDLIALKLGNNNGSNYSYTVQIPQYRSRAAGTALWSNPASWEISLDNGSSWTTATTSKPSAFNADMVYIRNGHTIQLNENITIDQLVIESGGIVERLAGNPAPLLTLADGAGTDVVIKSNGVLRFLNNHSSYDYIHAISYTSSSKILVESNGMIEVNNSAGSEFWRFATEPISRIEFQHNAIFYFNVIGTLGFGSVSTNYFPDVAANVVPVFRINASLAAGSASPTTINGVLEISSGKTLTWQNAGTKVLRNGIQGAGNVVQDNTAGQLLINGSSSVLGGGALTLNSIGLSIEAGTCSLISNKVVNNGPLTVNNGATLDAKTFSLTNSTAAAFILNAGATLISAHTNGVNGSIQLTGPNSFQDFANYTFNGTTNQSTGSLMGAVAYQINISNTGSAGNNIVTLSNNAAVAPGSTTIRHLFLGTGFLQLGTNGVLNFEGLTANPSVYASISGSGNLVAGANGGTLFVKGPATVNNTTAGWPSIYNMTIENNGIGLGVNFISNATISGTLTINNEGFVNPNAPAFASGSTLVYNAGGTYNRSIEWGQSTPLMPGYPHHVKVQNGTTLNLGTATPPSLEIGGDLTIGNSSSTGVVNMNSLTIPLVVKGSLTIGEAATNNSSLNLSSVVGGDLWLHGDFTRYANNYYNDNNRAIFFKGTGNSTISTPLTPPATIADPTLQDFSYCFIDKTNASSQIILNTPLGITQLITLTSGIVQSMSNTLIIKNTLAAAVQGGSASSYVNGPMRRYINANANSYLFPLGKANLYKPASVITTTGQAAGDYFTGEFFHGNNATPSIINATDDTYTASLLGILKDDYWQIDRIGSSNAMVSLAYNNAMTNWRTADGQLIGPCNNCNVAVVKRNANIGPGIWSFTVPSGLFSSGPGIPQYRSYLDNGQIISGELSSFSPFTFGYSFNSILGTLPVKILSFSGLQKPSQALLNWKIADSKDLQYFEVEHSRDGRIFTNIGRVNASGIAYQFAYTNPAEGPHYFRLLITEKNGNNYHSKTILLTVGSKLTEIAGLQNTMATSHTTAVVWSATTQPAEATLYNGLGQQVGRYQTQLLQGQNLWKIPVNNMANGLYLLQINTSDGIRKTLRLLKQ